MNHAVSRTMTTLAILCACMAAGGCGLRQTIDEALAGDRDVVASANRLDPEDFTRRPQDEPRRERVKIDRPKATAAPAPAAAEPAATQPPAAADGVAADRAALEIREDEVLVDAMVGQVTGRPIYASAVFKRIGLDQLRRLGETQPRLIFKQRVAELIVTNLKGEIDNALVLAEAEAGLNPQQQMMVAHHLRAEREKILAGYAGSEAEAEKALRRELGHGIQEELESRRQRLLVDKFLREKINPKVSVSRREVEVYYDDHQKEINPPPTVTLRVIVVHEELTASKVDAALAAGEPFEEVAKKHSLVKAKQGGAFDAFKLEKPLSEFSSLAWPPINEAVRALGEGERSGRINGITFDDREAMGWVMLEEVAGEKHKTLADVQVQIERTIQKTKFNKLSRQYIDDLWAQGNFTPLDEMTIGLIDVAMARFARPQ